MAVHISSGESALDYLWTSPLYTSLTPTRWTDIGPLKKILMDSVPDVTTHGPGTPVVAIVGGIHGDEPSGVRAVERLRRAIGRGEFDLQRGIALVVGNPPAVAAGVRYLDSDLNRSFPGDIGGDR